MANYWLALINEATTTAATGGTLAELQVVGDRAYASGSFWYNTNNMLEARALGFRANGALLLDRTLRSSWGYVAGTGVSVAADGSIYLAGYDQTSDGHKHFLTKLDRTGKFLWRQTRSVGAGSHYDNFVVADASGGVYVAFVYGSGTSWRKIAMKLDASGAVLWQTASGVVNNTRINGAALSPVDNALVLVGVTPAPTTRGICVDKIDAYGNFVWRRTLSDATECVGTDAAVDASGAIYVSGYTASDFIAAKFAANGDLLWQRVISTAGTDAALGAGLSANGGALFVGYTKPGTYTRGLIAEYSASGVLVGQRELFRADKSVALYDVAPFGAGVAVVGNALVGTVTSGLFAKLAWGGSGLGAVGEFTYADATFTDAPAALTLAAPTISTTVPSAPTTTTSGSAYSARFTREEIL